MVAIAKDILDRLAATPAVIRGISETLRQRLRHPRETPGQRMPISLVGVPNADALPRYYLVPFHGQPNGYLSEASARAYDLGVHVFFLGSDVLMRRTLVRRLRYRPRRILELGCGTGSSTLLLARRFPDARIDAVDLSPFFLERAAKRLRRAGCDERIRLHLQNAESLPGFADDSFDLVTSTFLHHELPLGATRRILREAWRLLEPGKQVAICDAVQEIDTPLGAALFPRLLWEPYYNAYKRMDWEAELRTAGYCGVRIKRDVVSKTVFATKPI